MLNQKQHKFLVAMLEETSIADAIERAGITRTTAFKYLNDPEFKEEFRNARQEIINGITNRLWKLDSKAIDTLDKNLTNEAGTPFTRSGTAKIILDFIYRSHELDNITERLDEMEQLLEENK